jgi:hypothetical protein
VPPDLYLAVKIHFCLSPICASLWIGIVMARKNPKQRRRKSEDADGFRISNGPVVRPADETEKGVVDFDDVIELSRIRGAPTLFAIARDSYTIFIYWSIDWPTVFAKTAPVDRQVHLRIYRADGIEEKRVAAEPMAGDCYITLSRPGGSYHVEIGYYQPADVWHSVAVFDELTMPTDKVAEDADVHLATIPFHLSFQRLLDLFRASNGAALASIISEFQKRALNKKERELLNPAERKILRAMDLSLRQIAAARSAFIDEADNEPLRKRTEGLLGFGSTSPSRGFGESSWS